MANTNVQHPDVHLDFNAAHVMHIVMTQLSMKASMKHWGEHGTRAVSKELQQLHHCNTFEPVDPKMMTSEDFHEALKLHLFLKQKLMILLKEEWSQMAASSTLPSEGGCYFSYCCS